MSANGGSVCRDKQYFKYGTLPELFAHHPPPKAAATEADAAAERERRLAMLHFCQGVLMYSPAERWTPQQALHHPFITGDAFSGSYEPPARDAPPRGAALAKATTITISASPASSPLAAASLAALQFAHSGASSPAASDSRSAPAGGGAPASTKALKAGT